MRIGATLGELEAMNGVSPTSLNVSAEIDANVHMTRWNVALVGLVRSR